MKTTLKSALCLYLATLTHAQETGLCSQVTSMAGSPLPGWGSTTIGYTGKSPADSSKMISCDECMKLGCTKYCQTSATTARCLSDYYVQHLFMFMPDDPNWKTKCTVKAVDKAAGGTCGAGGGNTTAPTAATDDASCKYMSPAVGAVPVRMYMCGDITGGMWGASAKLVCTDLMGMYTATCSSGQKTAAKGCAKTCLQYNGPPPVPCTDASDAEIVKLSHGSAKNCTDVQAQGKCKDAGPACCKTCGSAATVPCTDASDAQVYNITRWWKAPGKSCTDIQARGECQKARSFCCKTCSHGSGSSPGACGGCNKPCTTSCGAMPCQFCDGHGHCSSQPQACGSNGTAGSHASANCTDASDTEIVKLSHGKSKNCAEIKARGYCDAFFDQKQLITARLGFCCKTCGPPPPLPPCPRAQFHDINSKLPNCNGDQKCLSALTMQLSQSCLACLRSPANRNDKSPCLAGGSKPCPGKDYMAIFGCGDDKTCSAAAVAKVPPACMMCMGLPANQQNPSACIDAGPPPPPGVKPCPISGLMAS
eukprot:SAG25_NODE_2013_length_2028_cov_1.046138_2_plen_534_part_01